MATKILKFGGSSVGTPDSISKVIEIFSNRDLYPDGCIKAVVVSAFRGVTDTLISLAVAAAAGDDSYRAKVTSLEARHLDAVTALIPAVNRSSTLASTKVLINELSDLLQGVSLIGECTPRTLDLIMSFGERLSALVVSEVCRARGVACELLDTRPLIRTNESFGNALIKREETYERISTHFESHSAIQIATGFIASTHSGATTTLGRGGSDYTASILGAAIAVDEVEIWTDVDGMLTCDPRKVPKAFPIPNVTVEEAMELCHFGAKVIYPPTMQPAVDANIPLIIKNTFNPSARGTRIVREAVEHEFDITGISSISDVTLLRIQGSGMVGVAGVAMRFFKALATNKINVILITQASSEHTICCAIDPLSTESAQACVQDEFGLEMNAGLIAPLVVEGNLAIVSVVGERMRQTPGISGRIFTALGANGINIAAIAQGSSELNISAVIPKNDEAKALNALHDEFFISSSKTLNVWIAGTGLIGSTLLRQIQEQESKALADLGVDLQIRGLANSRRMKLTVLGGEEPGVSISLTEPLSEAHPVFNATQFVQHILTSNVPNCIFVDCTASEDLPQLYSTLLERNIAVVTPNKRSISGSYASYQLTKNAAKRRRAPFLHETCVGAGLPVLSTLTDLVKSGDHVLHIEAILSGTLSYIFNTFSAQIPFSEAVLAAKKLGLTEPDPRDDLSGLDVARKVLILAREAGLSLELPQVTIDPLLPKESLTWPLDQFLARLPELDGVFEDKRASSAQRNERLFFGAAIDCVAKSAHIGLRSVALDHPFCALRGSDNIVAFTTRRYSTQPLVVKGPGAGAEVTAAGVFADIIRIAR
jgi:aspartokinase/homoserine dehydrogenase 1